MNGGWAVSMLFWFDNTRAPGRPHSTPSGLGTQFIRRPQAPTSQRRQHPDLGLAIHCPPPQGQADDRPVNPGADTSWTLTIPAETERGVNAIEAWLRGPQAEIKCEYKYGTRNLKENSRTVRMNHLQGTRLEAETGRSSEGQWSCLRSSRSVPDVSR